MKVLLPRTVTATALQALALLALLLALAGVRWLDDRARPGLLVLVDRSLSVPRVASDAALVELQRASGGARIEWIEFAGRPGPPGPLQTTARESEGRDRGAEADLLPSVTNLEGALDAALAAHAQRPYAGAVVLSDGHANAGDSSRALSSAREAGLPIHWRTVARPAPAAWIADVQAPTRARRGQALRIVVPLEGETARTLRVTATARHASGALLASSAAADQRGVATLELESGRGGPLLVSLSLEDAASGEVLDLRRDAVAIDVVEPARLLYLQGSPGPLAGSLLAGGWTLESAPARRADAFRDRLAGYEGVVLDDVAYEDASPGFWRALADEVTGRGLGLLVLGGERSFARGGYRESVLESVLPVLSEPAALDQPASVLFAVDKSGSMGEGSGGVNRLSLAQRAVLETAQTLAAGDSAGVVVFDVEPRLLLPLAPAAEAGRALAGSWPVQARGGTSLAPAIELAAGQLEAASGGRRILVVVTDGFVDDAPLDALRRRLADARIEVVALAIGPDADATALARLTSPDAGVVLRVDEAAELPRAMSAGLERRRARIERGRDRRRAARGPAFPRGPRRSLARRRGACGHAPAAGGVGLAAVRQGRSRHRRLAGRRGSRGRSHERARNVDAAVARVGRLAGPGRRRCGLGEWRCGRGRRVDQRVGCARGPGRRCRPAARRALGQRLEHRVVDRDAERPQPLGRAAPVRAGPTAGDGARDRAGHLYARRLGPGRRPARAAPAQQSSGTGRLGRSARGRAVVAGRSRAAVGWGCACSLASLERRSHGEPGPLAARSRVAALLRGRGGRSPAARIGRQVAGQPRAMRRACSRSSRPKPRRS
jgi:hypothetical protein